MLAEARWSRYTLPMDGRPADIAEAIAASLARTDWTQWRSMRGTAEDVPDAVGRLLTARSAAEAVDAAFDGLDNSVVVQGQLFSGALPLVDVLIDALALPVAAGARHEVLELLLQILMGEADVSERRHANGLLGSKCRAAARARVRELYEQARSTSSPKTLAVVWELIAVVEVDRQRLRDEATAALASEEDPHVCGVLSEIVEQ